MKKEEKRQAINKLLPDLEEILTALLKDCKDWADDWARDCDKYPYVVKANKILKTIKKQ